MKIIDSYFEESKSIEEHGDFIENIERFNYFGYLADREREYMLKNYKFIRRPLSKICHIRSVKKNTNPDDYVSSNTIYIPRVGARSAYTEFDPNRMMTGNYYELKFDPDQAIAEYMKHFSNQNRSINIKLQMMGAAYSSITKKAMEELVVPIPSVAKQKVLLSARNRLNSLANAIENYSNEITFRPDNVEKNYWNSW